MADQNIGEFYNALAAGIDDVLNPKRPKKLAFCLMIAPFGDIKDGKVSYISNGTREDMIAMVKEWLARTEGRYTEGNEGSKQ